MKRATFFLVLFLFGQITVAEEERKIKTIPVKKQHLTKTIEKSGTVIPWKTMKVSSEINGILENLHVDKGDHVTKEMFLADVDRHSAFLEVEAAQTRYKRAFVKKKLVDKPYRDDEIKVFSLQVEKSEENKKHEENTYKRISKLFSEGHVSEEERDDAETKYQIALTALKIAKKNLEIAIDGSRDEEIESAENEILIAKKNLDISENNLRKTRVVSVVEGIVSNKYVEEGEFVRFGQVLVEIVVLDPVKITFAVSEQELSYLLKGNEIEVTVPAIGKKVTGKVSFISPVADPKTHLYTIELFISNEKRDIYPGMTSTIHLATNTIEAYPIRADWLRFNDNELGVFALSKKRVKFIPVNQKNYLAKEIFLFEGLEEGDEIIIFSSKKLLPDESVDG
ncbi:MAG: HlyD family efflux transporter periplasmic adaptor subunit [Candidatus Scalindua sp. AMX11]|nr:MAG: HlyD family efflux transporter periplasmic adaptor subunit [Candidatus Scalindua sp.]NOG83582.1 HlyD family efflux transporter periplasmic adaptor subunit [Planctomycetota bacterium]RZV70916.1 MAG: HlyD family efflux transporter periplasmic adaptor subunit [Candidatus Scalindua sp. SCAELEC01]TDE64223.1 MAG: HlyD family efflux transporter periplasmic adaptor subunit [Candidatus Scalindua sp. AMX11]GJQ59985.1 MAG: macrolide transporter subunit MacA [Candidatus Scalindua sp.]